MGDLSQAAASEEVVEWFRSRSHPLRTAVPDGDDSDLRWLAELVGEARLVSLGEASHGTSEFFSLKHRFVKYLVEGHGFTEFAIEANFAGGRVVDEWVQGSGPDTAAAANIALSHTSYHTWDTVEVLDMIRWMRNYNEGRPDDERVHFHGFDVGGSDLAARQYFEYLERVDPGAVEEKVAVLGQLARNTRESDRETLMQAFDSALAEMDANRSHYEAASSPREFALTRLGLHDAQREWAFRPTGAAGESMAQRDLAMADNCLALLEAAGEGRKLIVWAHNGHVARQTLEVPANPEAPRPSDGDAIEPAETGKVKSQGLHLAEQLGDEQRVVGFALGGGLVKMWDLQGDRTLKDREFGPPPEDTVDAALARLKSPLVAVDLRSPPAEGRVSDWLRAPRRSRCITAGWFGAQSEFFGGLDWLEAYDAIVYVERSTGVTYNPTVAMSTDEAGWRTEPTASLENLDFSAGIEGWNLQEGGRRPGAYQVSVSDGVLGVARPESGFRRGIGGLYQYVDAQEYRGKRLTLRAEVRGETEGRFDGAFLFLASKGTSRSSEMSGPQWSTRIISVDVAEDATMLMLAVRLHGNGRAEFRALELAVEPQGERGPD